MGFTHVGKYCILVVFVNALYIIARSIVSSPSPGTNILHAKMTRGTTQIPI